MAVGSTVQLGVVVSMQSRAFMRGIGDMKRVTAGLITAFGTFSVYGAKRMLDFSEQLANLNTLLKATPAGLTDVGNEIKALSADMGVAKKDLVETAYQALSSGVPKEAMMEFTRLSVMLAKVGRGTADQAAEALIRMREAWPDESDATLARLLFQTVEDGIIKIEEMGPNLGKLTNIAKSAGLAPAQMLSALAAASKNLGVEESITGIKSALDALVKGSTEDGPIREFMRGAGYDSMEAMLGAQGLVDVLRGLTKEGGTTASALTSLFPEKRARQGVLALLVEDGASAADTLQKMNTLVTAFSDAWSRFIGDNAKMDWQKMMEGVDNLALSLGEHLIGPLREVTVIMQDLLDNGAQFERLIVPFQKFFGMLDAFSRFAVDQQDTVTVADRLENLRNAGTTPGMEIEAAKRLKARGIGLGQRSGEEYMALLVNEIITMRKLQEQRLPAPSGERATVTP